MAQAILNRAASGDWTKILFEPDSGEIFSNVVTQPRKRNRDDGAPKGWGRCVDTVSSWFVLSLFAGVCLANTLIIEVGRNLSYAIDQTTVICHEPSVSRASVAAAKLKDPADASLTIWWRPF
jgi:hypothetical protein